MSGRDLELPRTTSGRPVVRYRGFQFFVSDISGANQYGYLYSLDCGVDADFSEYFDCFELAKFYREKLADDQGVSYSAAELLNLKNSLANAEKLKPLPGFVGSVKTSSSAAIGSNDEIYPLLQDWYGKIDEYLDSNPEFESYCNQARADQVRKLSALREKNRALQAAKNLTQPGALPGLVVFTERGGAQTL